MKTDYQGIDYGRFDPTVNRDTETGIRYGVIPVNDVPYWDEHADANYGDPCCPQCGRELPKDSDDGYRCGEETDDGEDSDGCGYKIKSVSDECFPEQPYSWSYKGEGYLINSSGDNTDLFVIKSPFFTYAQHCSPCAPGASHLRNPLTEPDDNCRAYCLGHDWFEDDKAPYDVYSVATGEKVEPVEP